MGLQLAPGFISGGGTYQHPVELFRNLLEGLTAGGQKGILTPTSFAMTPSGSLMQLTIGPGYAVIAGEENSSQGSYFAWSNASEVLAWPAHSAQARWDTLLLRIIDTQYGVDASPQGAYWEIVQGTPAGSPVKVADVEFQAGGDFYRPGAWWRVADVLVQSTDLNMAATDITDYRALANPYQQRADTAYAFQQQVKFTASGTFTKANYPLARKARVRVCGAGGGGGGAATSASGQSSVGSGAGGGCYAESWVDIAGMASTVTVTVGTGGTCTPGANDGTAGGQSSFGATVLAPGGGGGLARGAGSSATPFGVGGGAGGTGGTGDLVFDGGPGGNAWGDTSLSISGEGGDSHLGGGGVGQRSQAANTAVTGNNGGQYGGGGAGALTSGTGTGRAGGNGAAGIVIVDLFA